MDLLRCLLPISERKLNIHSRYWLVSLIYCISWIIRQHNYLCSNLLLPLFIISFLIKWENHTKADNEISDCDRSHFRWDILFFPTHYEICIQEKALSSLFLVNNQFGPNHKENADLFVILSTIFGIIRYQNRQGYFWGSEK